MPLTSVLTAYNAWASCARNDNAWECTKGFADRQSAEDYHFGERGVPTNCIRAPNGLFTCRTDTFARAAETSPAPAERREVSYCDLAPTWFQDWAISHKLQRTTPVSLRVADPTLPPRD